MLSITIVAYQLYNIILPLEFYLRLSKVVRIAYQLQESSSLEIGKLIIRLPELSVCVYQQRKSIYLPAHDLSILKYWRLAADVDDEPFGSSLEIILTRAPLYQEQVHW